jgi:aminopeptidase N
LLDDSDPYLRMDVARALTEYGDVKARGALHERLSVDLDPRVRRRIRESLRDLGGDGKRGLDNVREELEKVTTEAHELRARIVQLETRSGMEKKSHNKPEKQGEKRSNKKSKSKKK